MNLKAQTKQKLPFAAETDSLQFYQEVVCLLIREFDNRRKKYVPTENCQVFHHGGGWNFQRREENGFKPHTGELEQISTGCEIKLDRIVSNDVTLISDFIRETANRMEEGFIQMLIREMADVTEETGNTISIPKEGSLADVFLDAIKTTPAAVTSEGTVSRPTLFLNDPSLIKRLERELVERGPDFQKQIEKARNEQEEQALAHEAERLARYDNLE